MRACGVVLAAAAAAVPAPAPTPPAAIAADASYGTRVISLENAERAHAGCQPLRADPAITAAATEHARDMGTKNFLGHDSSTGVSPWARMKAAGYDAPAAENIAAGDATPEDVVSGWMDDQPHRANILNCSVKATGVGFFRGSTPGAGPWWTQDFGYR